MNRIKKYLTVKWCAMISALLGMLGYAACGSKDDEDGLGPCLYGQPHAYFKVEGSVLNEEGKTVEGVKVYVRDEYGDTTKTNQDGKYVFEDAYLFPTNTVWMIAEDPSGIYERDSVEITPRYEGGDGDWYSGSYSTTLDFTLKKKPAEPEENKNPEESENPVTPETPSDSENSETPSAPETPSTPEE